MKEKKIDEHNTGWEIYVKQNRIEWQTGDTVMLVYDKLETP